MTRFFEIMKVFYPRRESAKAATKSTFDLSIHLIGAEKGVWGFKNSNLEYVLSPGGILRKQIPRGSFDPSFHFTWLGKGVWGLKNTKGDRTF